MIPFLLVSVLAIAFVVFAALFAGLDHGLATRLKHRSVLTGAFITGAILSVLGYAFPLLVPIGAAVMEVAFIWYVCAMLRLQRTLSTQRDSVQALSDDTRRSRR